MFFAASFLLFALAKTFLHASTDGLGSNLPDYPYFEQNSRCYYVHIYDGENDDTTDSWCEIKQFKLILKQQGGRGVDLLHLVTEYLYLQHKERHMLEISKIENFSRDSLPDVSQYKCMMSWGSLSSCNCFTWAINRLETESVTDIIFGPNYKFWRQLLV